MTFRERHQQLLNDIYTEYQKLLKQRDYNILESIIKDYYDTKADEILEQIENEGIDDAVQNWDILECCDEIFYNDRRGNERMCYLLGVEMNNGLYVYDNETYQPIFLPFSSLDGTYSQLTVIESMQEFNSKLTQ